MNSNDAEAIFISCTALPIMEIIEKIEKKITKPVLSSNQVLIWDCLRSIKINNKIKNYGLLFRN